VTDVNQEVFRRIWDRFAQLVDENKAFLNDLDAKIGDADHGTNMARGLTKVVEALDASDPQSLRADAKLVGMTLLSTVGGASGALWGSGMLKLSAQLPDAKEVGWPEFVDAFGVFVDALSSRGQAVLGDKTMMDVLLPAATAFREQHQQSVVSLTAEVSVQARVWSEATEGLVAKRGRASYLGERSVGHVDPGSVSAALFLQALAESLGAKG